MRSILLTIPTLWWALKNNFVLIVGSVSWLEWTQQLQAYIAWVNSQLRKRPGLKPVKDLRTDLQSGEVLAQLIEIICEYIIINICSCRFFFIYHFWKNYLWITNIQLQFKQANQKLKTTFFLLKNQLDHIFKI